MAAFDNLSNPSEYLAYWGKTYRNELLSNILHPLAELSQCILDSSNGSIINVI